MPKSPSSSRSSSSSNSSYRRRSTNRYRSRSRSRSLKSRHVKSTFHNFDNTKSISTVVKPNTSDNTRIAPRKSTPAVTPRIGENLRTVVRDANPEAPPASSMGEKFRGRTPLKLRYSETREYKITIKQPLATKMRSSSRPVVLGLDNPDDFKIKRADGEGSRPIFARSEVIVNKEDDLPISYRKRNDSKSRSRSFDDSRSRSRSMTKNRVVRYEPKRSNFEAYRGREMSDRSANDRYNRNIESKYSQERTVRYSPSRRARSSQRRTGTSRYLAVRDKRDSSSPESRRRYSSRYGSRDRSRERDRGRYRERPISRSRHRSKSSQKEKSSYYIDEQREKDRIKRESTRKIERLSALSKDRHYRGDLERRRSRSTSRGRRSSHPRGWSYDQRHMEGPYEGQFIQPPYPVPFCDPYGNPQYMRPYMGHPSMFFHPMPRHQYPPRLPPPQFPHPFAQHGIRHPMNHPPMNHHHSMNQMRNRPRLGPPGPNNNQNNN